MNYSGIKYSDMINGPGIRVSLFVSGCSHACPGCFNKETWNPRYGEKFTEKQKKEIFDYFKKYPMLLRGLSLLGGDPTYKTNIEPLTTFVLEFRKNFPEKDIWMWSGYTWEEILSSPSLLSLVKNCDVLVEGKFIETEKDLSLQWRGSRNQRVIDISKSLQEKSVVLFEEIA